MENRVLKILVCLSFLFASSSTVSAKSRTTKKAVTKEIIIKFHKRPGASSTAGFGPGGEAQFVSQFNNKYSIASSKIHKLRKPRKLKKFLDSEFAVMDVDKSMSQEAIAKMIKKLNKEKFANSDYQIEAVFQNQVYEIVETLNDPLTVQQWSISMIKPDKLWQSTKGAGSVVAVIDTGVDYTHEDLAENIWINRKEIPDNGLDDDRNGYVDDVRGWDFVSGDTYGCAYNEDCGKEDNDPMDRHGHGTHVAGIVAAVQNNNIGISGIAPEAEIMALRAGYSSGSSAFLRTSDIIEALTYAINNGADVINMSFAGYELGVLEEILSFAEKMGVVAIAAAGNNGSNRPIYPAAIQSVIAVGAVADNNMKPHFSNFGSWVDIVAPGSWVMSTIPGNKYANKSGTSMSSPHVAAVAALIRAKNKTKKVTVAEIKQKLLDARTESLFYREKNLPETIGKLSAEISFPFEIDEIKIPSQPLLNETIQASAKASDPNSEVVEYLWESDVDGVLSNSASFETSTLSFGPHLITVKARNANGDWSEPVYKQINVVTERSLIPNSTATKIPFKMKKRKQRIYAAMTKRNRKRVAEYQWTSNLSGPIGTKKRVKFSDLQPGYQQLSLMVKNKDGSWTGPVQQIVYKQPRGSVSGINL